jgi:phage replication-related protein YjqB (UPF0714/DUF867 family)
MADKYKCFDALCSRQRQGQDFRIRSRDLKSATVIVAPHGGGIEPGTSEIAEAISGNDMSFYVFEGTKRSNNKELHITSAKFNEPACLALVGAAERVITIHGENCRDEIVFLGGCDTQGVDLLRAVLGSQGFVVRCHKNHGLQGLDPSNICNRGRSRAGIQLELSYGLRRSLFHSLLAAGRKLQTKRFRRFVGVVREVIEARTVVG